MNTITTKSKRLEQFFYAHGIDWVVSRHDDEGMPVWEYPDNEETRHIVDEFKLALARRAKKKGV